MWNNPEHIILFAAGNSGSGFYTVGTPANAKNIIGVGAASGASNLAGFSSRGPTPDGRIKPDLVAPGAGIVSAQSGSSCSTVTMSGTSMV